MLSRITSKSLLPPNMDVPFFFQAEDGIRDHCVTGVQTCALPIFRFIATHCPKDSCSLVCSKTLSGCNFLLKGFRKNRHFLNRGPVLATFGQQLRDYDRSEERRVGKECRTGSSGARGEKR